MAADRRRKEINGKNYRDLSQKWNENFQWHDIYVSKYNIITVIMKMEGILNGEVNV